MDSSHWWSAQGGAIQLLGLLHYISGDLLQDQLGDPVPLSGTELVVYIIKQNDTLIASAIGIHNFYFSSSNMLLYKNFRARRDSGIGTF